MRAHTEVDDTIWSFVKVFLQFLKQNNYLQSLFSNCLQNMSCAILLISVVSFFMLIALKQLLKKNFYRNFKVKMSFEPRITQSSQIS